MTSKIKKSCLISLLAFLCLALIGAWLSMPRIPSVKAETSVVSAGKYAEFRDAETGEVVGAGWGNVATNMTSSSGGCAQPDPNHTGLVDIVIDLGKAADGTVQDVTEYYISKIYLNWDASNYASEYEVQVSADDSQYQTVATVTGHTGGPKTSLFTETKARYVRVAVKTVVCAPGMPYGVWGAEITGSQQQESGAVSGIVSAEKYAEFRDAETGEVVGAGWGNVATNMTSSSGGCAQPDPSHTGLVNIVIDLGKTSDGTTQSVTEYLISQVYLNWDATNYASAYEVQVSTDDMQYQTVASVTGHTGGPKTSTFTEAKARYVRIAVQEVACAPGMPYGVWGAEITGREVPGAANLAAGKAAVVDGTETVYTLTDASAATVYSKAQAFDAVVYFGGVMQISQLTIVNPESDYVAKADILLSDDLKTWTPYMADCALTAGENVLPEKTANVKYLKISAKESSGSAFSLADIEASGIILREDADVALEKDAYIEYPAGASGGVWGEAEKMNDGDAATYAQGTTNQAIMRIELRDLFRIHALQVNFYNVGYATEFTVEGSFDGQVWQPLAAVTNGNISNKIYLSEEACVRSVRLTVSAATGEAYAVTDFCAYGVNQTNLANADNSQAILLEEGGRSMSIWDTQPLSQAFDEDDKTLAQSRENKPWDIVTDLGGYYKIDAVRYLGDWTNKIETGWLEFSNNGVTYEKIFEIKDGTLDPYQHYFLFFPDEELVARYVRLNVLSNVGGGGDFGHAVGDFAIYGTPAEKPNIAAESVQITNKEEIPDMLYPGETFRLELEFGNNLSADNIVWTSSNDKRLEVDASGLVTAKMLGGTFTVTVTVGDSSDSVDFSVYRVMNLASRSAVSMEKGTPGWGNVASKVVDGDYNTFSQSFGNSAYDLVIDMYGELKVGRVVVYTYDGPPSFTLSVSSDGVNYTVVETEPNAEAYSEYAYDWEEDGGKTFRYLKFSGEKLPLEGIDYGYSIREIEIYNHTSQSLDNLPSAPVPDNGPYINDNYQPQANSEDIPMSGYDFGTGNAPVKSPYPEEKGINVPAIVAVCVLFVLAAAGVTVFSTIMKNKKGKKE